MTLRLGNRITHYLGAGEAGGDERPIIAVAATDWSA
jgi:hypothetical protein